MVDLTESQKWNVVAQCLLRYDRISQRLEDGAMDQILQHFGNSISKRTIQIVLKEFMDQKDDDNIDLSPKKKGVVGKKPGLTDD